MPSDVPPDPPDRVYELGMINTVAIVGVGLIGGSFGLSLRRVGFTGEILGVSCPGAITAGLRVGAISSSATLTEAAARADVLYLAQPVDRILGTLDQLGTLLADHPRRSAVLVTDAGSTKNAIVAKADAVLSRHTFLGGHPMAGKEKSGVEVSDANLFVGRPYVLTPYPGFENPLAQEFRAWIVRIGAFLVEMPPEEHDAVVALTSHLPQLISTSLAMTLAAHPNPHIAQVHGSGLLDMTRLAMSSPDLWQSIISTNQKEVLHALDAFSERLQTVRNAVLAGDISTPFVEARTLGRELGPLSD
jgi:prephenate dehydrogenase